MGSLVGFGGVPAPYVFLTGFDLDFYEGHGPQVSKGGSNTE